MAKSDDHGDQHNLFTSNVPKMPDGYYSGDKPNLNLRKFVEEHIKEHAYNPAIDNYDVPGFDRPIEASKATDLYNMHSYWSKKPNDAIREYIRHYTKQGDLVLDPFCGSGGTALAALVENRKAIAIDISPASTFITSGYCTPLNIGELNKRYSEVIIDYFNDKNNNPYFVKCSRCNRSAEIKYVLLAQTFQCVKCLRSVIVTDCEEGDSEEFRGRTRQAKMCPYCGERIKTGSDKRLGHVPTQALVECTSGCKPKRSYVDLHNEKDIQVRAILENYKKCDSELQHVTLSDRQFRYGLETHIRKDLNAVAVLKIKDLFTTRNLIAIDRIVSNLDWRHSHIDRGLMFVLTSMCLQVSRMVRASNTATLAGTYYVPPEAKEVNAVNSFKGKYDLFIKLQYALERAVKTNPSLLISTQSSTELDIPSNSVDYIFTDPPYGDKFQYAELNAVWDWLLTANDDYWDQEIIVNSARKLNESHWASMLKLSMSECYRVLKPGRWLSLCYHDTSDGTWELLQDIMAEVGFVVDKSESALFIDTNQKSYNQTTADKVNKRDLVINFRKPVGGEITGAISIQDTDSQTTFNDKVRLIISQFIEAYPGSTKDRIFDELVSHMVRVGRMESHNFEDLLRQVAESTESTDGLRWYIKDSSLEIIDAAESAKEDSAADKIGAFVSDYMKKYPIAEGVHYSDIFEQYVYIVKERPRRPLVEWLLDYFFKTDQGTYRPAITDEEKRLKADGRSKGTQRRIKRYIAFLQQSVAIPEKERPNDSTLAEWIRHCKRSGLYEQGKLLYEKGGLNLDGLAEEAMVNVEEDYQVCVRMLARGGVASTEAKPKRGRKA